MWFNIIPPIVIVAVGVGGPGFALWWIHKLVLGNHFRRTLTDRWDRQLYQRDIRINGNPYSPVGLEAIPDD